MVCRIGAGRVVNDPTPEKKNLNETSIENHGGSVHPQRVIAPVKK
jgi:hypothetical protein